MPGTCILFFLKYPQPGKVKTRLAATVGNEQAMEAFRWMVETSWQGAESLKWERQVCGTPSDALGAFDGWLKAGRHAKLQSDGNLGERLATGVTGAFAEGFQKVICVGGDCVQIGEPQYQAMSEALDSHDVAVLPAHDGGYVAIGMKAPRPAIFEGIQWSTDSVFEETLAVAKNAELSVWVGETFTDIDTFEDWINTISGVYSGAPKLTRNIERELDDRS